MKNYYIAVAMLLAILLSGVAEADKPSKSVYLEGGDSKKALILCHGRGKHPTSEVVDPLRKAVHEELGYHTLSLQMPNRDTTWRNYAEDFPEAYETLKEGVRYLRKEKGVTTIYLMGHSMGARMASAFISENPKQPIAGLIVAGCRNNGEHPLSCKENLQNIDIPVLDAWGGKNKKDARAAVEREGLVSENYQQLEISGANHRMSGKESRFVSSVIKWIKAQK